MKTPIEVARWYLDQDVKSDARGTWLFTQGDNVHWCAGFAMTCCRESGHWLETKLKHFAELRSVAALQQHAEQHKLFTRETRDVIVNDNCAGVLYLMERDGKEFGHVGVLAHLGSDHLTGIEGNTKNKVMQVNRKLPAITGYIIIPKGGLYPCDYEV